jgi:hypothetical protein
MRKWDHLELAQQQRKEKKILLEAFGEINGSYPLYHPSPSASSTALNHLVYAPMVPKIEPRGGGAATFFLRFWWFSEQGVRYPFRPHAFFSQVEGKFSFFHIFPSNSAPRDHLLGTSLRP